MNDAGPLRPFTKEWNSRYSRPAHLRPSWASDLERELVAAGLASWDARTAPHPMNYVLVVERFLADRGVTVEGDQ